MRLIPCPCCQRHVKIGDTRCPFCGTQSASSSIPSTGLLLALAVGAGTLVACSSSDSGGTGTGGTGGSTDKDASADSSETGQGGTGGTGGVSGAYGPPADANWDTNPQLDAAYGPPPEDAMDEPIQGAYGPAPWDAADEGMQTAYGPPPEAGTSD
jgi:hypothetical protein